MTIRRISNNAFRDLTAKCRQWAQTSKSPMQAIISDILAKGPLWDLSQLEPVILNRGGGDTLGFALESFQHISFNVFTLYQDCIFEVSPPYSDEEIKLLVMEEADKERQRFESLRLKFQSEASQEILFQRTPISEEVRVAVWRRDKGRCAKCASRENLEYDHIIPLSEGGSNSVRNIELLCEKCNRSKSNKIK